MERRGLPNPTHPWILLRNGPLHRGAHLTLALGHMSQEGTPGTLTYISNRQQRYKLRLPSIERRAGPSASTTARKPVFGEEEIGKLATSLFQSALTTRTRENYNSNLASFYTFCDTSYLDPLAVGPIDIARYIAWLGQRVNVAAESLQPFLSVINKLLLDHALPLSRPRSPRHGGVAKASPTVKRTPNLALNACRCRR